MYTKLFGHHLLESSYFWGRKWKSGGQAVFNGSTCLIQLHPQCHAYNTWAFIQDGRLLTKTELLPWAFKRDGRLIEEGAFNQVNTVLLKI